MGQQAVRSRLNVTTTINPNKRRAYIMPSTPRASTGILRSKSCWNCYILYQNPLIGEKGHFAYAEARQTAYWSLGRSSRLVTYSAD